MQHLLMISRCPPYPLHLGDRLIVYHLAEELAARGVEIDLLAFAEYPTDWSLTEQQHYSAFFRSVTLFDMPQRPLPEMLRRAVFANARFPQEAEQAFAPEMWHEITRRIAAQHYDAVHLFGGVQVFEFLHALQGLPTVITPYESYSLYLRRVVELGEGGLRERLVKRLELWGARNFERWMFCPYAFTTVVSDVDEQELKRIQPKLNVKVIPNGVDIKPLQRETKTGNVVFIGNYEYEPNVDAALWLAQEIFPLVQQSYPNAKLWLVGNEPPDDITALEENNPAINVTGRVPDIRKYLAKAAVFVCPLRVGAGIKNKVLEALVSRAPVVATPLSVDGISVTDGESVLLGDTAEELAAQTLRLLTDDALAARLGDAGHNIAARYTWGGVAEEYLQLYTAAAQQNRSTVPTQGNPQ